MRERTLAERLHKLTTLENKEVMSDSKIDQLANLVKEKGESFEGRSFQEGAWVWSSNYGSAGLIQSRTLKPHFPTT